MNLLFVNCCMRSEKESRTFQLCRTFIEAYEKKHTNCTIIERNLNKTDLSWYTNQIVNKRDSLTAKKTFSNPLFLLAQEFAQADKIIIGAPYWDLSFPALLKVYIENIFACGVTFVYENGKPVGLCKAEKLLYITTSGGFIAEQDFGTQYIKGVCEMLGIKQFSSIKCEGLDIQEIDTKAIFEQTDKQIKQFAEQW